MTKKTVTVYLKDKSKADIKKSMFTIFSAAGYEVVEVGGLTKITKRLSESKPDLMPFFYKPKYRDTNYLTDMVSNLFDIGAFTFKRPVSAAPTMDSQNNSKNKSVDTGFTATAQISKPYDAFIFNGTKSEVRALEKLLTVLDVPEEQVEITAYLYEVSNTDNKSHHLLC